jgi:hypothetical protein
MTVRQGRLGSRRAGPVEWWRPEAAATGQAFWQMGKRSTKNLEHTNEPSYHSNILPQIRGLLLIQSDAAGS